MSGKDAEKMLSMSLDDLIKASSKPKAGGGGLKPRAGIRKGGSSSGAGDGGRKSSTGAAGSGGGGGGGKRGGKFSRAGVPVGRSSVKVVRLSGGITKSAKSGLRRSSGGGSVGGFKQVGALPTRTILQRGGGGGEAAMRQRRRPLSASTSESSGRWQRDLFNPKDDRPPRIAKPLGTTLKVSNLDYNVVNEDITELFATCGELVKAGIHFDRSGRSLGTADVVFKSRKDAEEAVRRFNNVALDGQKMVIEMVANDPSVIHTLSSGISVTALDGGSKRTGVQLTKHFMQATRGLGSQNGGGMRGFGNSKLRSRIGQVGGGDDMEE